MPEIVPERIERYAELCSAPESPLLKALARETRAKTELSRMLVGRVEGDFLRLLVRLSGARNVLEIGTFTGYSALAMAEGLPAGGRLVTLDVDKKTAQIARSTWNRSSHGAKIEQKLGKALDSLKTVEGPFDLVFIDADKSNYVNYWEACVPKDRRGGLLVADNVLWSGRVLSPADADDRAIVSFNEHVRADRRVEAVLLTVRDGMTLAWKK
ncbi:MAG TPA: class I SAM-dependent methyltransferase [Candidatus Eisenbacteria bacterium]|nr:class I SAM-dependent methyltransferase [Candidatus Eisenbacteria bacterium]